MEKKTYTKLTGLNPLVVLCILSTELSKRLVQPCETSHKKAKYKITPKEIWGYRICVGAI